MNKNLRTISNVGELSTVLYDKSEPRKNVNLAEDGEIIIQGEKNAIVLNIFFSNAVRNLKVAEYNGAAQRAEHNFLNTGTILL